MTPISAQIANKKVRVRIPPSPTGFMHIATARMALFNYLFAKQNGGLVVLRLENTDKERSKKEFADDIVDGLKWLGLAWDEGPYYQSQRGQIYKRYLQKLLDEDKAYYCFCSHEELEAQRQYQMSRGEAPIYSGKCAEITRQEAESLLAQGKKPVIRFRGSAKKIAFDDIVRGDVEFDGRLLGDFVIAKDFDNALYNFIVVVDDFEMGVTHVIRGEDHISNTPKQILIQEALDLPRPVYAHLPMILAADRSKMSKRHGAVAITEYRKQGYLPEALLNFIAFLGWNPGTDKEVYSIGELIKDFSLKKIQKGGAIFNQKRLDFLNSSYIRQYPAKQLAQLCVPYLIEADLIETGNEPGSYAVKKTGELVLPEFLEKIVLYHQPRLKKLSEITELSSYFFAGELSYDKELLKWGDANLVETTLALDEIEKIFSEIKTGEWSKENLEAVALSRTAEFNRSIGKLEKDRGYLLWPLRVSLCGQKMSIGPFEMADVLGREKTLQRIRDARQLLNGVSCSGTLL